MQCWSQICNLSVCHQAILILLLCATMRTTPLNNGSLNFHNRENCQALTQYIFPRYSYSGKYTHWEIRFGRSFSSSPGDLQLCDYYVFIYFLAQNKQFTSNAPSVLQIWPYRNWRKCKKKKKKESHPLIKKHVRVALQFHPWLVTVLKPYTFTASKQRGEIGLWNAQNSWRIKYNIWDEFWIVMIIFIWFLSHHSGCAMKKKPERGKWQVKVLKLKFASSNLMMEELLLLLLHRSSAFQWH